MLYMFVLLSVCAVYLVDTMPSFDNDVDKLENEVQSYNFPFISREDWLARTPNHTAELSTPVPYVVIHHSLIPPPCYDKEECSASMRQMQNMHIDGRGWCDIGYNFGVGSDGAVYEGRGWKRLGAHSLYFNSLSIGICLIGDWTTKVPPANQLRTAKVLIASGVRQGFIRPNYKLLGHRQVRATDCPGEALYKEIQTWEHYSSFPTTVKDLVYIPELPESVKEKVLAGLNS